MINIKQIKWLLFIIAGIILILWAFGLGSKPAGAVSDDKVWICHCEPQKQCISLHIAPPAALRHLREHDGDYRGRCVRPSPTPTPAPTTRMCHWDGDGFEAIAVTETERARHFNAHRQDKNWEEGMDARCEFPPEQCDLTFGCEACQNDPNEHRERLGICYEDFIGQCSDKFGCGWVSSCPTNGLATHLIECKREWVCKDTCETPEPTPTPEPKPEPRSEGCTENCGGTPPQCSEQPPVSQVANFHVYRKGGDAILKWFPGDDAKNVHIYYKQNGSDDWQYSVRDLDNTGYYEIGGLGDMDITFAIQQANGCAAGYITSPIVDGPTSEWVLFR